jgi:hypothetical protein
MKRINQTSSHAKRPELRIVEKSGVFKIFDKNDHFRCSFATREAAQAYIDQRTGVRHTQAAQAQTQATQVS